MDYADTLPLVFLYTDGREAVEGATRFQKLVFLAQEETDVDEVYEFIPAKYGPYSPEVKQALHTLEAEGLVEQTVEENSYGEEKYIYTLTIDGIQRVQGLLNNEEFRPLFDAVQDLKKKYNNRGLERLLKYVYRNYEKYATKTELDTDRLFDPEAESVFAESVKQSVDDGRTLQYREYISNADVFENPDGTWTARDLDHELTAMGDTRTEALNNLGEVIAATEDDAGREVTDEDLEALGLDPEQARNDDVEYTPDFMT